jgi:hypothetical protein
VNKDGDFAMTHSAKVSAYLCVADLRVDIAKMNRDYLTLADACELAPETEAQLNVIIDEKKSTQMILLNDGVAAGQREVRYSVPAPPSDRQRPNLIGAETTC